MSGQAVSSVGAATIVWDPEKIRLLKKKEVNEQIDKVHETAVELIQEKTDASIDSLRPKLVNTIGNKLQETIPIAPQFMINFATQRVTDKAIEGAKEEIGEQIDACMKQVTDPIREPAENSVDCSVDIADVSMTSIASLFIE
jgi:hypothetical protein